MGLIAWWKLNGDLLDSSGNGNHGIQSNGTMIYADGVVGKAAICNFNQPRVDVPTNKIKDLSEITISYWWYGTAAHSSSIITGNNAAGTYEINIHPRWSGNTMYIDIGADGLLNNYDRLSFGVDDSVLGWHHWCIVKSCFTGEMKVYKDGILLTGRNGCFRVVRAMNVLTICSSLDLKLNGNLQDLRIYDHCLSDKEIYDLSKALVLKYDFDNVEEPTVNLSTSNTFQFDGTLPPLTLQGVLCSVDSSVLFEGKKTLKITYSTSTGRLYLPTIPIYTNDYLTFSAWVFSDIYRSFVFTVEYNGGSYSWTSPMIASQPHYGKGWQRMFVTIDKSSSDTTGFMFIYNTTSSPLYVCDIQIEKKDHATPFVNGTRNNVVVRDKSDYGNDSLPLTVSTTPAFIDDCKIGKLSTEFDKGVSDAIRLPNLGNKDKYSISFWCKHETSSEMPIGVFQHTRMYWYGVNSWKYFHGGVDGEFYYSGGKDLNYWQHRVVTYDGTKVEIFIDGVSCGTKTTSGSAQLDNFCIGNSYNADLSSIFKYNGFVDDLRIYATALSADDIKEIYQSRANLDDKGNLQANSFNHFSKSLPKEPKISDVTVEAYTYGVIAGKNNAIVIYKGANIVTQHTRGWTIFVFDNMIGDFAKTQINFYGGQVFNTFSSRFDVYDSSIRAQQQNAFVETLKNLSHRYSVLIICSHSGGYITEKMREQMSIYGGTSKNLLWQEHRNYILFGHKNLGDGNAIIEQTDNMGNYCKVDFEIFKEKIFSVKENGEIVFANISEMGVTEGLIAHYPLNGNALDYSGNGNDGIVYGATVAAGQGQKCYSFDGVDDYIDISSSIKNLVGAERYTLHFKFYDEDSVETNQRCVLGLNTGLGGNDNKLMYFTRISTGVTNLYNFGNDTPLTKTSRNTYVSVALIIDTIDKKIQVFQDGVSIYSGTFNNSGTILATDKLFIGQELDGGGNSDYFKGKIQDVRIYNRALSPEEVLINYNLTKTDKTAMIQAENGTTYVSEIKEV